MIGRVIHYSIFIFIFLFVFAASCGQTNPALQEVVSEPPGRSSAECSVPGEYVVRAKEIITAGFKSKDMQIKKRALSMMEYMNDPGVYNDLLALFNNFEEQTEELHQLKDEALKVLVTLNKRKIIPVLIENNDFIFEIFDFYYLFRIIGFDYIPYFDNIFYWYDIHMIKNTTGNKNIKPLILAEMYRHTNEEKYLNLLKFYDYAGFSREDLLFIYDNFKNKNIPVKKIELTLKYLGSYNKPIKTLRSYTLEDILFSALLYRLHLSDVVYNKDYYYKINPETEHAIEKYNIPKDLYYLNKDVSMYTFSPYFVIADACAYVYAGIPEQRHQDIIIKNIKTFENTETINEIISSIVFAPGTSIRNEIINNLIASTSRIIRKKVLYHVIKRSLSIDPDTITRTLLSETSPDIIELLLMLLGNTCRSKSIEIVSTFLNHENVIIQLTAAGQMLRFAQ